MKSETNSNSSHDIMPRRERGASPGIAIPSALFAVTVLTRLPFTSRLLYNMDSVQFALGMRRFDVALHQPQPPGYYLYVLMGRLSSLLFADPNTSLIAVSILFSGLVTVMLYMLGFELFGKTTGMIAALFGITSPLLWFHGEVALSYMPEAFMSLLTAWLCIKAVRGKPEYAIAASVVLGVAGGIRQNTMVFLMPLWLFAIYRAGFRRAVVSCVLFAATVAAWFLPMLAETGGYARYSAALRAHWLDANWRGIHLHWVLFNARYMTYFILSGLALAAVPLIGYCLDALRGRVAFAADKDTAYFFALWLLPAFLFHLIIFTHPAVPGHSLIYLVGLIILAARTTEHTAARFKSAMPGRIGLRARAWLVALIAAVNTVFFLAAPYPLSAKGISEHDKVLSHYISYIGSAFSPEDTVIIGTDRFLYSYRHAMYYLPRFKVYNTILQTTPEGPRLFWGMDMQTHRARYIVPGPGIRHYVDFLNYRASENPVFPPGALVHDVGGGWLLPHYEDLGALSGVARISPLLKPEITDGVESGRGN